MEFWIRKASGKHREEAPRWNSLPCYSLFHLDFPSSFSLQSFPSAKWLLSPATCSGTPTLLLPISISFYLFLSPGLLPHSQITITWPNLVFILVQEKWEQFGSPLSALVYNWQLTVMHRWAAKKLASANHVSAVLDYKLGKIKDNLERP